MSANTARQLDTLPRWNLDASHSSVTFSVRHMMVAKVRGEFREFSGSFEFDPADLSSLRVSAAIDMASIHTRDEKRDEHLRSADFFDVQNHPQMTFTAKSASRTADGWAVTGDLTIRGATHEVTLAVEGPTPEMKDPWGNSKIGLSATTKISRSKWGITWNGALEAGGVLVGDEVSIELNLELARA